MMTSRALTVDIVVDGNIMVGRAIKSMNGLML